MDLEPPMDDTKATCLGVKNHYGDSIMDSLMRKEEGFEMKAGQLDRHDI